MLHIYVAEVGNKKRALRVRLVISQELGSIHNAIPEMDLGVTTEQRWQSRKENLVLDSVS